MTCSSSSSLTPFMTSLALARTYKHSRSLDAARRQGLEAAARIQAAAYATHVGVTMTALLSAEEERLTKQAPLAELRLTAIVDTFAGVAAGEVARLGI